jgi:hypothetical protein
MLRFRAIGLEKIPTPMETPSNICLIETDDEKPIWLCVKHFKSNAIFVAKSKCMIDMDSDQSNHMRACV